MPQDGNCLFHAAAYCISKLTKSELIDHHHLRAECVSHLRKHDQRYIHDWDGEMPDGSKADSFDAYCNAMAKPKTWGSSFELQAIARMYDTKFVVFPTVTSPGSFCRPCPTEGTCCCDPFQWHISMSSSLRVSCAKNLSASAPHRRVCLHEVVDARPPFSQHPQRSLVSRPVFTKPHRRAATVWTASGSVSIVLAHEACVGDLDQDIDEADAVTTMACSATFGGEAKHSPKMMLVDIAGHAPCALMSLSNRGTGLRCSFGSPPAPSQWSRPPRQTRTPC